MLLVLRILQKKVNPKYIEHVFNTSCVCDEDAGSVTNKIVG